MKTLISILSLLPLRVLYGIADGLIYPLMYYVVRYRRGLSYRNIRSSFPEKTEQEVLTIQKKFYHHLADVIVEIVHMYRVTDEQMLEFFHINHEMLEEYAQKTQGVIIMLGHLGNWEYTVDTPKRFTLDGMRQYNVYRQLKSKSVDDVMKTIRERRSGEGSGIEKHNLLRHLLTIRKTGQPFCVGLISDQKPSPGNDYYWTEFLHHDTAFLGGGEVLAKKLGYTVLYAYITCPKRSHYEVKLSLITEDPANEPQYAITEEFARRLEANIQAQPEQWLWTHNRWKWNREGKRQN